MNKQALLIEIGTQELPPKSLKSLSQALTRGMLEGLANAGINLDKHEAFATPRRLAFLAYGVDQTQTDKPVERRGPAVRAAYDDQGEPTKAAQGFAKSCGVAVGDLETLKTDKGEWLVHRFVEQGQATVGLIPDLVASALNGLPIPKRMRWGDKEGEFVRPVQWIVAMMDSTVVPMELFDLQASNVSRGHRFHAMGDITIDHPDHYAELLEKNYVIASFERRRDKIEAQVNEAASNKQGHIISDDELLDEITALVEWPVAVTGEFDPAYLSLPKEVLISTLKDHQRYFPIVDGTQTLMPYFITVSNIESKSPEVVQKGNERVIRPRLEDAAFFYDKDKQQSLAERTAALDLVTFQNKLGSLGDKTKRIVALSGYLSERLSVDADLCQRAAILCKSDLVTDMVGEFPELQGTMGYYYALHDNEPQEIATAIKEHYQPRFANDQVPASLVGATVALADKSDTLAGIFAIGQIPSGTKDPFGLRRNALGVIRIILESNLDVDLGSLMQHAVELQPVDGDQSKVVSQLTQFFLDRLKNYCLDQGGCSAEHFAAVSASGFEHLPDFQKRLGAVIEFAKLEAAQSLAAANKRIANILKQNPVAPGPVDAGLIQDPEEQALFDSVEQLKNSINGFISNKDYGAALTTLAKLRPEVDQFFDQVMVVVDQAEVKDNRLRLLASVREMFLRIADVQHLQLTS